jgi:integrase
MTAILAAEQPARYRSTKLGGCVSDYLAWKESSGAAQRTLDQYERDLARVCLLYPELSLEEWGSTHCLHALALFPAGSQKRVRAALSDFFRWARIWQRSITENPIDFLPRMRKTPQRVVEVFSDEEERLLTTVPALHDRVLMAILFSTGIRKSEARHLRLRDIDIKRNVLRVWGMERGGGGKGGKDRLVPILPALAQQVAELAATEKISEHEFLWYGTKDTTAGGLVTSGIERRRYRTRNSPIGSSTFHRWWTRVLEECGIPPRANGKLPNPHLARHTYATKYLRDGGSLENLADNLGHTDINTTKQLYVHLGIEHRASELLRIAETRAGRSVPR